MMNKLSIFLLFSALISSSKAYDWREYDEDTFGTPCYAYYLVWPTIPKDLCLTTYAGSSDLDVSLEECDFGKDPPHPQIWYSSRGFIDLVKTSMDATDWRAAHKCLSYLVDGPEPSGPIKLLDCDERHPSSYFTMMAGNIFWDWDDMTCMIPETNSCPMPGDSPIMSTECEYNEYNYGHAWHIQYVEPTRAQNSVYLISEGTVIRDDGFTEVIDGNDTIELDQQRDGNFKVMRNTNVLFDTVSHPEASLDYYTKLQGDCNLITRKGRPWDKGDVVWKSDIRIDYMPEYWKNPECFLALNKDDDTLSIYVGTPDKVFAELWNSNW